MPDALLVSSQQVPEGFLPFAVSQQHEFALRAQDPISFFPRRSVSCVALSPLNSIGESGQSKNPHIISTSNAFVEHHNTDVALSMEQAKRTIKLLKEYGRRSQSRNEMNAEMRWLTENRQHYSGRWIAIRGERLLAVGNTAKEVFEKIADEPVTPLVIRVEDQTPPFAGW